MALQKARAGEAERAENMARCAVALRDGGRATVSEMARRIGTSRPTVAAALADLVDRDLVFELPVRTTGGRGAGRPARLYEFHSRGGYIAGVDVGAGRVKVAVADLAGTLVGTIDAEVDSDASGQRRLTAVQELVHRAMTKFAASPGQLVSLGVAVTGLVGEDGKLRDSRVLSDWEGWDLAGMLEREFDCAAGIENDIRLATLAEHRLGAARGTQDVICLFAGRRLAMGTILSGRLRRGRHGAAGEVGDIIFSDFADRAGTLRWTSAGSAEEVFRRAAAGDESARAEVLRFVTGLSTGLATLVMGIDPDLVVIGGGLSKAGDVLLEPLRVAVAERITVPVRPDIVASALGTNAVVLGALVQAGARLSSVTGVPEPQIGPAGVERLVPSGPVPAR